MPPTWLLPEDRHPATGMETLKTVRLVPLDPNRTEEGGVDTSAVAKEVRMSEAASMPMAMVQRDEEEVVQGEATVRHLQGEDLVDEVATGLHREERSDPEV